METRDSTRANGFGTIRHIRGGEQIPVWDYNKLGRGLVKLFKSYMSDRTIVGKLIYWLSTRAMCGTWKPELCFTNTITTAGYAGIAARLIIDATAAPFDYIAVGTGTTSATSGDTTLETEITDSGLERAQDASPTRSTTTETNDTSEVNYTFTATGSKTVAEYGLFNAAAAGIMYCRTTATGIPLVSSDQLAVTWKIKHSA
jgi:hypothetical protein